MSVFLAWAVRELNQFGAIFQRHVFQPDTPFRSVCQCVHISIVVGLYFEQQTLSHHNRATGIETTGAFRIAVFVCY